MKNAFYLEDHNNNVAVVVVVVGVITAKQQLPRVLATKKQIKYLC